ncbi:hypothetical protein [Bradyrhizobium nanningense]|nr:hypothetical protein [Bradyrhizobium nanningense]
MKLLASAQLRMQWLPWTRCKVAPRSARQLRRPKQTSLMQIDELHSFACPSVHKNRIDDRFSRWLDVALTDIKLLAGTIQARLSVPISELKGGIQTERQLSRRMSPPRGSHGLHRPSTCPLLATVGLILLSEVNEGSKELRFERHLRVLQEESAMAARELQRVDASFKFNRATGAGMPGRSEQRAVRDHESRQDGLLDIAFEKSWKFVDKDPFLAHSPRGLLRARLQTLLEVSASKGERDLLRLANGAIWKLRDEFAGHS